MLRPGRGNTAHVVRLGHDLGCSEHSRSVLGHGKAWLSSHSQMSKAITYAGQDVS